MPDKVISILPRWLFTSTSVYHFVSLSNCLSKFPTLSLYIYLSLIWPRYRWLIARMSNSIANALELLQFCTKPLVWSFWEISCKSALRLYVLPDESAAHNMCIWGISCCKMKARFICKELAGWYCEWAVIHVHLLWLPTGETRQSDIYI